MTSPSPAAIGEASHLSLARSERSESTRDAGERVRAQVSALRDRILQSAEMKCIGGAPLSGRMLLTLTESYIAAINARHSLNVGDAWGAVADAECELRVQRCLAQYNTKFLSLKGAMPLSTSELSLWQVCVCVPASLHARAPACLCPCVLMSGASWLVGVAAVADEQRTRGN